MKEKFYQIRLIEPADIASFRSKECRGKIGHKGTIWGVFVRPEYRSQGIAKTILKRVIDHAYQLEGVSFIKLSVNQSQEAARALYLSLGFKIYGKEPKALKVGEQYFSEELFYLDLLEK